MEIPKHLRITKVTVTTIEPDRRYRVLVLLQRSDREKYWTFNCPRCTMPVCEILNAEIEAISDLISIENIENVGNGVRCDGRLGRDTLGQTIKCNIWYYFKLNG